MYWYGKNLQGDIVAVYSSNGTKLINYTYNAWGTTTKTYSNNGASTTAIHNNLTYRGYYYDADLGMYYLQSRYYDAKICRFISADGQISGVGGDIRGYNLFAYCMNNPVNMTDDSGNWPKWVETTAKIVSAVVAVTAVVVMATTISAISAGTATPAVVGATVLLGSALSGINGGVANESNGNSYLNGYIGGATGGAIQSALSKTATGTILGGGLGVTVGTALTDIMNNFDPDSVDSTTQEIVINSFTSGTKALVTSSLTAFIGYASKMAVSEGANGMMPEYTFGFGEAVKAFFGWVDDALVYIWE